MRAPNPYNSRSPSPAITQSLPPHPHTQASPQNFCNFPQSSPIPLKSPSNFLNSPAHFLSNLNNFCETPEKLLQLRTELKELRSEVALLTGMNENKELYIKELEEKVASLCSENRREGENTYILRKKEEHYSILLKEQKKLFEKKHKDLAEELEKARELLRKTQENSRNNFSVTHEFDLDKSATKAEEIDKTFLETSLKVYKINLKEMHAKIATLNGENGKISQLFNEKCKETQELSQKLRETKENQEKLAANLEKLLAENKKIATFNASLLAELELSRENAKKSLEKHEKHVEELEICWKKSCEAQIEELKLKNFSENSRFQAELRDFRENFATIERQLQEKVKENAVLAGKIATFEEKARESREKDAQNLREIELLREKLANSQTNAEKLTHELAKSRESAGSVAKLAILEAENQGFVAKLALLEAESQAFREKMACFEAERAYFQGVLQEKSRESAENAEKSREIAENLAISKRKLQDAEAKAEKLETHVRELLGENMKLNQISKKLMSEAELFEVKAAKSRQNAQDSEFSLKKALLKTFEEERGELFEEIGRKSREIAAKMQEIASLQEGNRGIALENAALVRKLAKIEENHEVQMRELAGKMKEFQGNAWELEEKHRDFEEKRRDFEEKRRDFEGKCRDFEEIQRNFEENRRDFEENRRDFEEMQRNLEENRRDFEAKQLFFQEKQREFEENREKLAILEETLRLSREKLVQFHGIMLDFQRKLAKNPDLTRDFRRTLEESEKTLFLLQDVLRNRDFSQLSRDLSKKSASFLEKPAKNVSFLEETSAITRDFFEKNLEIDQLIGFEREHSQCYQEIRRELLETRENFAIFKENSEKHANFLENQLKIAKSQAEVEAQQRFCEKSFAQQSKSRVLREISENCAEKREFSLRKPAPMRVLSENEALNAKILKRCREILH